MKNMFFSEGVGGKPFFQSCGFRRMHAVSPKIEPQRGPAKRRPCEEFQREVSLKKRKEEKKCGIKWVKQKFGRKR